MKIDATVKKETLYVSCGMLIMSALMQAVFLILGEWNIGVLYSNLLTGGAMLLNFFALGLTVQKAVSYEDADKAKQLMRLSQSLRFIAMIAVLAVGVLFSDIGNSGPFSFWALLPPLLFNRITIMVRGFMIKNETAASPDGAGQADEAAEPPDGEDGAD